jgi:hypothetical protein
MTVGLAPWSNSDKRGNIENRLRGSPRRIKNCKMLLKDRSRVLRRHANR